MTARTIEFDLITTVLVAIAVLFVGRVLGDGALDGAGTQPRSASTILSAMKRPRA